MNLLDSTCGNQTRKVIACFLALIASLLVGLHFPRDPRLTVLVVVLLSALVGFSILFLRNPAYGVAVIIALDAFDQLQISDYTFLGIKLSAAKIVTLFVIFMWLTRHMIRRERIPIEHPLTRPLIAFVVWYWTTLLWSENFDIGLGYARSLTMLVALCLLILSLVRDKKSLSWSVGLHLTVSALVGVIGIIQWVTERAPQSQAISVFTDHSALGLLMALNIGLVVSLYLYRIRFRRIYLLYFVVFLVALITSFSRSSIVAVSGGILFLFLRPTKQRSPLILPVLIIMIAVNYFSEPLLDRFSIVQSLESFRMARRIDTLSFTFKQFLIHPWGIGLGSYIPLLLRSPEFVPALRNIAWAPHSVPLRIALEQGLVGVILLCWIALTMVRFLSRQFDETLDPFLKALTLGGMAALLVIYPVYSFIHGGLHVNAFWTILGLTAAAGNIKPESSDPDNE